MVTGEPRGFGCALGCPICHLSISSDHFPSCNPGPPSLGSCPCTWLIRSLGAGSISQILLLDPVTLYLSHPAVAVNFVYKRALNGVMERVIYYGASTELYIAHYLHR